MLKFLHISTSSSKTSNILSKIIVHSSGMKPNVSNSFVQKQPNQPNQQQN